MKTSILSCILALTALTLLPGHAQTTTVTTTTTTSTVNTASDVVKIARDGVDPSLRDHLVSIYGTGAPTAIDTWWVIFYDPAVPSHGRAVKVVNNQIVKTYEAKGGVVYGDTLTFAPTEVTGEGAALAAAQTYAADHSLTYDHVRVLLRVSSTEKTFRWRVQLMNGANSKGFVFVNTTDGAFAMYAPPGAVATKSGTGTGVEADVNRAANQVKNTFLGIGGDLQEFFTGDRTVDQ